MEITTLKYVVQNYPTHDDKFVEELRASALNELAALEAENAALRRQLEQKPKPAANLKAKTPDPGVFAFKLGT